jgi:hypothetical protein
VNIALRGPTDWALSLLEDGNRSGFRNAVLCLTLDGGKTPKEKIMSINLEGTCESNMKVCARNMKDIKIFVGKLRAKLKR